MRMCPSSIAGALAILALTSVAASQGQSGRTLETALTGAAEVPGPGDADGSGTASLELRQGQGEVCFEITWKNIEDPTAAHIHKGAVGVAGPVVVLLFEKRMKDNRASGCVEGVDRELIKDIRQNPENYYINVHNEPFPPGAIRGQLGK